MSILIEDSPRNLLAWMIPAVAHRRAAGIVISPFASPWIGKRHRRDSQAMADQIRRSSGEVWFDATTHALQMPGVGDFRYYDEYSLWDGPQGDLSSTALRLEHIKRVFKVQDDLGAPHLGPTILVHYAESTDSQHALDFAAQAMEHDAGSALSIAGSGSFWASGPALDAHIGALIQLEPSAWFLTVARPTYTVPVEAEVEEVHGLCRTVRALSEYAPVHICCGDLAALPAIAAGATSVGTGWDQRQRVCSYAAFAERDSESAGGGWYARPTFHGLMGSLLPNEAEILTRRDPGLARRLGPPPAPGPREAFDHHLEQLNILISAIERQPTPKRRYETLANMYASAAREWPQVVDITGCFLEASEWINNVSAGLERYARTEGW